ncbi:hypothetical protein BDW59DRAFT_155458, partial [Aspergillus cavernicola]
MIIAFAMSYHHIAAMTVVPIHLSIISPDMMALENTLSLSNTIIFQVYLAVHVPTADSLIWLISALRTCLEHLI